MRLFIAIPLDDQIKAGLVEAQSRLIRRVPDLKPTPAGQLHLTLNFLGDTAEENIPLIEDIMRETARGSQALSFELGKLGFFPARGAPRVVWASVKDQGGIARLQRELAGELAGLGFATEERDFFPHATIARIKGELDPRKLEASLREIELDTARQCRSEVTLYSSKLTPGGAEHTKICAFVPGPE